MNHDASQSVDSKAQTDASENGQIAASEHEPKRRTFFRTVFGQRTGFLCIAVAEPRSADSFQEFFFEWPKEENKVHELITKLVTTHSVWYCPHLFDRRKRNKAYVSNTPVLWADLDTCPPDRMLVKPSLVIESSPARFQALWNMEDVKPQRAEIASRRIAYYHSEQGADKSGWDLTQLLRVPYTLNMKYTYRPMVRVIEVDREQKRYTFDDFQEYPETADYTYTLLKFPSPDHEVFQQDPEELLEQRRIRLNSRALTLYKEEPEGISWSESLWQLELMLFEVGYSPEQVYVIAESSACNKFARDGRGPHYLWADVCRAYSKFLKRVNSIPEPPDIKATSTDSDYIARDIITPEEIKKVMNGRTFIEDYISWASGLGDAAPQYHQAGAFICLSSMLSGNVVLPTGFGTIVPNLWFMILADTTLTRKTTSMDIAMDLINEIDPNILMATDGSIEGLMSSLSVRPGRPSIFLRDEFSGLLEQMMKKDYMAGMAETLTKLYDGKIQKRILRKEEIIIKDPRLIIYAGGIKNRVTSTLTFEHVSSGFIPRFVFITAEVDMSRLKPMGPPTQQNLGEKHKIRNQLIDMANHYGAMQDQTELPTSIIVNGDTDDYNTNVGLITRRQITQASMTDDAWIRYQKLEEVITQAGFRSHLPDILTPVYDRLSKSMLKAAILIAASRQRSDTVLVEEIDILRAIYYGQGWKNYVDELVGHIGVGHDERLILNIMEYVNSVEETSRSTIMRRWRLTSRQTDFLLATMEQRTLIIRKRMGKGEAIYKFT
jgi:hypothetical protein